ncbi:hypothetical protein BD414DRAFT_528369 [Trametes punicea]|nr:hypothetical protein BD414DRAFT_528369 [Trametes punicea]
MDLSVHPSVLRDQLSTDSQRVIDAISQAQGAARSAAAALALLTWDILTTMDEEVKLIWPSDWTLPKALYFFVRYYSLVALTIQNAKIAIPCKPWLIFQVTSTFLVEAAVEVIIILRVYAIYAAQPKAMRVMLFGFAIEVALMAVSLGFSIQKVKTGLDCKAADLPSEIVLYSTASIVYEAFLFGMMMYGIIRGSKEGFSDTTLLNALVRDGAVAFLAIFLVMLMNTILFTLAPSTLVTVGFPWLLAILGTAGPRLIVNIRAQHAINSDAPSSIGDLRFRLPTRISSAHRYSVLDLEDPEARRGLTPNSSTPRSRRFAREHDDSQSSSDSDSDSDDGVGEDTALHPTTSRSRHSSRDVDIESGSDIGSQSPSSPLSPRTPLP